MNISLRRFSGMLLVCLTTLIMTSCSSEQQVKPNDFTLHAASGPVSLSDYRNQVVLLFFGYTHCPDVCPVTMNNVAIALRQLEARESDRIKVLFVTVDPLRDSAEHLAKYLEFFHPNIVGLTGSAQEIKKAASMYDVEFFIEDKKTDVAYEVVHSSFLFLLNGDGKTSDIMSHHTKPEDIAIALRKWLNALPSASAK